MLRPMDHRNIGEPIDPAGYDRARALLHRCATSFGFVAAPFGHGNYARIWSRDGVIQSLAGLLTGDQDLVDAARAHLETLAEYRGPHGEIPSNVDPESRRVSYGGTAGRVDADLWFVIGVGEYWAATGDDAFLEQVRPVVDGVLFLLGAWEYNNRGLIYVPVTGDWADEYLQHGYVLYDQALYLQALRTVCAIRAHMDGSSDHALMERTQRLRHLIRSNYWFHENTEPNGDIYHPTLFRKGEDAAPLRAGPYWMPYFGPTGYGFRFDALANVLVSLLGIADNAQQATVYGYAEGLLSDDIPIVPAFHPVITTVDEAWDDLQMTFQYDFRNRPYEYHNGGLWPFIGGFHAAERAGRGDKDGATRLIRGVHRANALPYGPDYPEWSFPEFVHGEKHTAGGTASQGWSAAGAVIGEHAIAGTPPFRITDVGGKIVVNG